MYSGGSHIVIFSANYLPNIGGVERFTEGVSRALVDLGITVTIVTNNVFGLPCRELLADGIDVLRIPCYPLVGGRLPLPKPNSEFRQLVSELTDRACDGVLVNTRFYFHSLLGMRFANKKGLRPIVLDHGSAYLTFGNAALDVLVRMYEQIITIIGKRYKPAYYGISQKSVEWLRTFGITAEGVISNSIDAVAYRSMSSGRDFRSEFGIGQESLLLTFTGRLIPEKGISALLEMMRLLDGEDVDLIIAGDGPLLSEVESSALGSVHYAGRLDQHDIAALLMCTDLFCLPTRSEGFSTSLLEAASCGTPFLVTDVGGARELAPDDTYGFVANSSNPEEFAALVRGLTGDQLRLKDMGARCRRRVEEQYSWKSVAEDVITAVGLS